ncbi:unnamed protein product [Brachionus calyciflorus]|uniref:Uncharacterized protein n=1 Tax=Brachionus calyciflorus TaxID=104777 RepID=A0A813ZWE9_9BILA|nr:unnamed protein product [Brachionus calyciflorus]
MSFEIDELVPLVNVIRSASFDTQRKKTDSNFFIKNDPSFMNVKQISTTNLIPSLNYFNSRTTLNRDLLSDKIIKDDSKSNQKINFEKPHEPKLTQTLKKSSSEPNLAQDRTYCFCSTKKSCKNVKKRNSCSFTQFSIIKFLKYLTTFQSCRSGKNLKKTSQSTFYGRSVSLDWINNQNFSHYKKVNNFSKKSFFRRKKLDSKCSNNIRIMSSSTQSIGSFSELETLDSNDILKQNRSHSCFARYSNNISLKESFANLNRIKNQDIIEEAINLKETKVDQNLMLKPIKKTESKRSFLSFRSYIRQKKSSEVSTPCIDKIDLRDFNEKKAEITDRILHKFLESNRLSCRRYAVCSRIDKLYHKKQLINYMEYLLREDYIQNFLM